MPTRYQEIRFGPLDLATPDRHTSMGLLRTMENLIPRGEQSVYLQAAEGATVVKTIANALAMSTHVRQRRGDFSTVTTGSLERKVIVTSTNVQVFDETLSTLTVLYTFTNIDTTRKAQFAQIGDVMYVACVVGSGIGDPEVLLVLQDDTMYELDVPQTPNITLISAGHSSIADGDLFDSMLPPGIYGFRYGYELADGTIISLSSPAVMNLIKFGEAAATVNGAIAQDATSFTVNTASTFGDRLNEAKSKGRDETKMWVDGEEIIYKTFVASTGIVTLADNTKFLKAHADATNVIINDGVYVNFSIASWPLVAPWSTLVVGIKFFMTGPIDNIEAAFSAAYFGIGSITNGGTTFQYNKSDIAIVQGEQIDDTNLIIHNPVAGAVSSYNRQLIIGDVMYDFTIPFLYKATIVTGSHSYRLGIEIKTSTDTFTRISDIQTFNTDSPPFQNDLVSYPDRRVTKFTIYKDDGTGTYRKAAEYDASKGSTTNMSYHYFSSGPVPLTVTTSDDLMPTIATEHAILDRDRNRVLVSESGQPFNLRAAGAYYVGNTEDDTVVAFAINAREISRGQFGVFPFFVLCKNTIWAFETGSTGQFTSLKPVDTFRGCISRYGVVNAGQFVFHVSHDGIWTLPTGRSVPLSAPLHVRDTGGFVSLLDSNTALGYFNDSSVGRQEIWVSAGGKVYGYSLLHGRWFTLTRNRIVFHDHENVLYSIDTTGISKESGDTTNKVSIKLVTAPLHFGATGARKKLRRLGVRLDAPEELTMRIKNEDTITIFEGIVDPVYFREPLTIQLGHIRNAVLEVEGAVSVTTQLDGLDFEYTIRQRSGARVY